MLGNGEFWSSFSKEHGIKFSRKSFWVQKGLVSTTGIAGVTVAPESAVFVSPNTMKCLQMPLLSFPQRPIFTAPVSIPVTSHSAGFERDRGTSATNPSPLLLPSACLK